MLFLGHRIVVVGSFASLSLMRRYGISELQASRTGNVPIFLKQSDAAGRAVSHCTRDPGSILTLDAICVKFAPSSCDRVGFLGGVPISSPIQNKGGFVGN